MNTLPITKKDLWQAKFKAFLAHLVFSAALIGVFMFVVMVFWFPGYLFTFENVWEGLRILVPVDAILGPILTLIIFVPGKKGLKGDLAIILFLQIAALVYGGSLIYGSKPETLAFVGDRFEVITRASYDRDMVPDNVQALYNKANPILVYPLPGQTLEEKNEFVLNNVQYQLLAERYRPLADHKETVLKAALDINRIKPNTTKAQVLYDEFKPSFNPESEALFILQGTTKDWIIVVINMDDYKVSGYLPINPWDHYQFPENN